MLKKLEAVRMQRKKAVFWTIVTTTLYFLFRFVHDPQTVIDKAQAAVSQVQNSNEAFVQAQQVMQDPLLIIVTAVYAVVLIALWLPILVHAIDQLDI